MFAGDDFNMSANGSSPFRKPADLVRSQTALSLVERNHRKTSVCHAIAYASSGILALNQNLEGKYPRQCGGLLGSEPLESGRRGR